MRRGLFAIESDEPSALEQLESVEKLAASSPQYDRLFDEVVASQQDQAAQVVDTTDSYSSSSDDSDSGSEDGGEGGEDGDFSDMDAQDGDFDDPEGDPDAEEDPEADPAEEDAEKPAEEPKDEPEDKPQETEAKNATESIRNGMVSTLAYEGEKLDGAIRFLGSAGAAVIDAFRFLAAIGIQYGPGIFEKVRKTVFALFVKSVKGTLTLRRNLAIFIKTRDKTFVKLDAQIMALQQKVQELQDKQAQTQPDPETDQEPTEQPTASVGITDQKLIQWLMLGREVSAMKSTTRMLAFARDGIGTMAQQTMNDIESLVRILKIAKGAEFAAANNLLRVRPPSGSFTRRNVKGYVQDARLLDMYVYDKELPNLTTVIVSIPNSDVQDPDEYARAYQLSGAFLGVSEQFYIVPTRLDYVTLDQASALLAELAKVVETCRTNQGLLRQIGKSTSNLTTGYKHYFEGLTETDKPIPVKDSLIEVVNMKQTFLNKTYLPCAMDMQDYLASYVNRVLTYVRASVKHHTL